MAASSRRTVPAEAGIQGAERLTRGINDDTVQSHKAAGYPRVNVQDDLPNEHYTYRVTWSAEDGEFVGLCAEEFPLLSWLASSQEEAFSGIRQLVADIVADMEANNERPPYEEVILRWGCSRPRPGPLTCVLCG